jgi:hypothetical protein
MTAEETFDWLTGALGYSAHEADIAIAAAQDNPHQRFLLPRHLVEHHSGGRWRVIALPLSAAKVAELQAGLLPAPEHAITESELAFALRTIAPDAEDKAALLVRIALDARTSSVPALRTETPGSRLSWTHPEECLDIPLTREQAVAGLVHQGFPADVATRAAEVAGKAGQGWKYDIGGYRVTAAHDDPGLIPTYRIMWRGQPPGQSAPPWPDLSRDTIPAEIMAAVVIVDAHLDEAAPAIYRDDHPASRLANHWRRIAAGPASEGIEAVDALNLATGGNPRKGVIGDESTILGELGDGAVANLLAIQSFTKNADATWAVFIAALAKALSRVPRERSYTHFPPESGMDDQAAQDNGITG